MEYAISTPRRHHRILPDQQHLCGARSEPRYRYLPQTTICTPSSSSLATMRPLADKRHLLLPSSPPSHLHLFQQSVAAANPGMASLDMTILSIIKLGPLLRCGAHTGQTLWATDFGLCYIFNSRTTPPFRRRRTASSGFPGTIEYSSLRPCCLSLNTRQAKATAARMTLAPPALGDKGARVRSSSCR